MFVCQCYLFQEAPDFLRPEDSESCDLQGTDNVHEQILEHIFTPNGGYCVYYPSNIFCKDCSFENWGMPLGYSHFSWGVFSHGL